MSTRGGTRDKTNTSTKHDARGKRKTTPQEQEESDSDFINGAPFLAEPKKKPRRVTKSQKRLKSVKMGGLKIFKGENPLKQWLGSDLDFNSASEPDEDLNLNVDDEEEAFGPHSSPIVVIKTKSHPITNTPDKNRVFSKNLESPSDLFYDSMTEPDSDNENLVNEKTRTIPHLDRCSPKKPLSPNEESVTEPESDEGTFITHKRKAGGSPEVRPTKRTKRVTGDNAEDSITERDSVTESESDQEALKDSLPNNVAYNKNALPLLMNQLFHPRPAFGIPSTHFTAEPLVLDESLGIQVTPAINRWLRGYQREGVAFFYDHYKQGRGGILGDDMGLGKTIQVIAFLSAIMKKIGDSRDQNRRQEHVNALQDSDEWHVNRKLPLANATWPTCLIIAPATVVHNWERELEKWGYFEVGMYTGTPEERALVLRDFELGRLDILVTSFELALRDIEPLESQSWSCIFVDEVHRVKNPRSQTSIALNHFACEVRFGLTGTAIQNNYTELWTILDWSNPGRLGTASQWNNCVTKPLGRGQDSKATEDEIATGRIVAERLVTRLLPNFFKRRTKDIIADQLPKKFDQVVFCPLTDIQKQVYKQFLDTQEVQTIIKKDEPCYCGSGKPGKHCHYDKAWVFQFIIILIKISNHLALILPAPIDTPEQAQRHRAQTNIGWPPEKDAVAPTYGKAVFDPQLCGKWKVLKDLLITWHNEGDNKVLIFTKSVKLIEMLEQRLKEAFMEFRKLDGSVKQKDRMTLIDEFNEDPNVFIFLISTMAGGVGLNLTGANKVVIFDPNWNPAHDLQAMDRAYRFGQLRDVSVYRLLGAGSLEELIYKRQVYKQQMMKIGYEASHQTRYFEGVQGDKTKQGDLFGLKNIFSLDESGANTKHTIERSHLAQLDWALAHLDGRSKRKGVSEEGVAIDEVNDKFEETSVKGLGALFFGTDDEGIPREPEAENEILKILSSNGVRYTHHNESLLKQSNIETRLTTKAIETKKKQSEMKRRTKLGNAVLEIPWPPKRKHHTSPSRGARLSERMDALIALGYIESPGDLSRFAEDFVQKPEEEQADILGELDAEKDRSGNERPRDA